MACCLPTRAQGSSVSVTGIVENGSFGAFGFLLGALVHMGGASLASLHPFVYRASVTWMCLLLDTPFGRRSVGALSL